MSCMPASYQKLKNPGIQADIGIRHRQAEFGRRTAFASLSPPGLLASCWPWREQPACEARWAPDSSFVSPLNILWER
jgi:hypothetical protein